MKRIPRYAIEVEKVGPDGYIMRIMNGRKVRTFYDQNEAAAFAERLEAGANNPLYQDGSYMRFEVIDWPPEKRVESKDMKRMSDYALGKSRRRPDGNV